MLQNNKNIICTISAGYSSVMMALKLKEWYPKYNIVYVFANTSKERVESLSFLRKIDVKYNLNIIYLEASFNERGKGVDFKIVEYKNINIKGEVFEKGIKKLGIPSKVNKWCNRDLKVVPIKKFADNYFGKKNYSIAIGIRYDEIDRVSKDYRINNIFYPLIDNKITTKDRNKFWDNSSIKIEIPAFKGNCDFCFEKSNRKLLTIIKEDRDVVNWWVNMVEKYSKIPLDNKDSYNSFALNGGMNFHRGNISIQELIEMSEKPFSKATDEYIYENDLFDFEGDCGKGCNIF